MLDVPYSEKFWQEESLINLVNHQWFVQIKTFQISNYNLQPFG